MDENQIKADRGAPRMRALMGAKIMVDKWSSFDCTIKSRSETGFGLQMGSTTGVPDEFQLLEEKTGKVYECRVAWRKKTMLGVMILDETG